MSKQKKDNLYKKNKTIKKQKKVKSGCNCGTNTLFSNGGITGGTPFTPATYIDGYVNPSSMYPLNTYTTPDPSIDGVISSRLLPNVKYGGNKNKSKKTKYSKHKIRKNQNNRIEKTYKKTKGGSNIFGQIVTLSNPLVSPESISLISSNLSIPKYSNIRLVP
jgi:hypothetical protein